MDESIKMPEDNPVFTGACYSGSEDDYTEESLEGSSEEESDKIIY